MRRTVVAIVGGLVVLAGIALLVLPGPGFVLVAAGLAILATQFAWARTPLHYAKDKAREGVEDVGEHRWHAVGAGACAVALITLGALALAGLDLPLVNTFSAVLLIVGGLFLIGTVVYGRRRGRGGAAEL